MTYETMQRALWVFEKIMHSGHQLDVTLTGGEPTLKPDALYEVARNINVDNIWFATNAKRLTGEFMDNLVYALERGIEVSIDISEDQYHEGSNDKQKLYNLDYYRGLIINKRGRIDNVIEQGRAKTNQLGWREPIDLFLGIDEDETVEDDEEPKFIMYTTVYVNAKGEIISGCDYSYSEQKNHVISNIFNTPETILQDYANYYWEELLRKMVDNVYFQNNVLI
jgi:MoaA/NifB/PqqE/SkfB family radical SAM enzyme